MRYQAVALRFGLLVIRLSFLFCLVSSRTLAADLPAGSEDVGAVPRYRLEIGQELIYQLTPDEGPRESSDAKKRDAAHDQMEWRIVVVRKNEDGSWRLYIRTKITLVRQDGSTRFKRDSLGYCDLHPDGSYSLDEQTAIFKWLFPYQLFCRLPDTAAAFDAGWKYAPPVYGGVITFSLAKRDGAHLHVSGIQKHDYSEVNKSQTTFLYDFDTDRGLAVDIAEETKELDTGKVWGRRRVRLISSTQRDPAWVARFHKDAQRYLDQYAKSVALDIEAVRAHSVGVCRAARAKARAVLVAGRAQAELDLLRELYDAHLQAHDKDEESTIGFVKNREAFFAAARKFSTNWEAKNFDGSTFRLADHRGQVVVLYFWTTGCEYCVLAGRQICQLAADYQGKDVAVIGMFVRGEPADDEDVRAKSFIAKSYRGFPHLEARDFAASYRIRQYDLGYPSTLVLDQAGKVQEVEVGCNADLAQHIRKIVDDLRSKPPAKTNNTSPSGSP